MPSVEDKTLSVWQDQINVRVKISGSGPPAVFLHGPYGLEWDSLLGLSVGPATRFTRRSTRARPPATRMRLNPLDNLWDLVLLYYELFDQLGLDAPAVVGHSYGGMLAAELAATNPASVSKLALINPIGLWRDDAPVKNWMSMSSEQVAEVSYFDPRRAGGKGFHRAPRRCRRQRGCPALQSLVTELHGQVHMAHSRQGFEEAHQPHHRPHACDMGRARQSGVPGLRRGVCETESPALAWRWCRKPPTCPTWSSRSESPRS